MDDLSLLQLNVDITFTYDARGRMLLSNEPLASARRPAPRLWLGRTALGNVIRFRADIPDALARRLTSLADDDSALRVLLAQDAPIESESSGPEYRFPESIALAPDAIAITESNRDAARETFPWLYDEVADWQPCFAVLRDGQAVSICFSSRIGARACAAGVETLAEFRGRGYASAVTAAWGAAVRDTGRIPLYGTSRDNPASQAVARHLELMQFASTAAWT